VRFGLQTLQRVIVYNSPVSPSAVRAFDDVECFGSVVVVEATSKDPISINGILVELGEGESERHWIPPHVGTVLATGSPAVSVGETVIFHPERGKHLFIRQDGALDSHVIVFGRSTNVDVIPKVIVNHVPVHYSILAVVDMAKEFPITRLLGDLVLIEAPPHHVETPGGILLPDSAGYGDSQGRVVMVGNQCKDVKVGDVVMYVSSARVSIPIVLKGYEDEKRFVLIQESGILLRV